MIFYFHDVLVVCFLIRDEPYGVSPTLTVGPNIQLISILKWLHRPIPQPQTHETFGPSLEMLPKFKMAARSQL